MNSFAAAAIVEKCILSTCTPLFCCTKHYLLPPNQLSYQTQIYTTTRQHVRTWKITTIWWQWKAAQCLSLMATKSKWRGCCRVNSKTRKPSSLSNPLCKAWHDVAIHVATANHLFAIDLRSLEAPKEHDQDTPAYEITPPPAILVSSSYGVRGERAGSVECSSGRRNQISLCSVGPRISLSMTSEWNVYPKDFAVKYSKKF